MLVTGSGWQSTVGHRLGGACWRASLCRWTGSSGDFEVWFCQAILVAQVGHRYR